MTERKYGPTDVDRAVLIYRMKQAGHSYKQIAQQLQVSVTTVWKVYRKTTGTYYGPHPQPQAWAAIKEMVDD